MFDQLGVQRAKEAHVQQEVRLLVERGLEVEAQRCERIALELLRRWTIRMPVKTRDLSLAYSPIAYRNSNPIVRGRSTLR